MPIKRNLFKQVEEVVKKIPKGSVMTYGEVAEVVGIKDARVVGWAMHGNTDPKVPCHRVVMKDGSLARNYAFGGWKEQRKKLLEEGVPFRDGARVKL